MTADPIAHKITELEARKEQARNAGSPRAIERQHEKGKLLACERLELLLNPGSFHELDLLARHRAHAAGLEERPYTDCVVTGWGTIDDRKMFVYSQDFTVFGGALGEVFAEKIHKLINLALKTGAPVIGLNDGAASHASKSGVATFVSADEQSCLANARYLLGFLPQNTLDEAPCVESNDDPMRSCEMLRTILPASANLPYDMKKVIAEVVDDGEFFEYFPNWAKSIVCGFSRIDGHSVP